MRKTYSFLLATALSFLVVGSASAQQRYLDEVFTSSQITHIPDVAYGYNFS